MLNIADKKFLFENFVTKEELRDQISELRNELRNDFMTRFDEVIGELRAMREEQAAALLRLIEHEERITTIEEKIAF